MGSYSRLADQLAKVDDLDKEEVPVVAGLLEFLHGAGDDLNDIFFEWRGCQGKTRAEVVAEARKHIQGLSEAVDRIGAAK